MNVPERISAMLHVEDEYKVRRGNVSLRVTKNEVDKYFDMGYDVYSSNGELIKKAVPKDLATLQKAFVDNRLRIERLEEEIKSLRSQLETKPEKTSRSTKKKAD